MGPLLDHMCARGAGPAAGGRPGSAGPRQSAPLAAPSQPPAAEAVRTVPIGMDPATGHACVALESTALDGSPVGPAGERLAGTWLRNCLSMPQSRGSKLACLCASSFREPDLSAVRVHCLCMGRCPLLHADAEPMLRCGVTRQGVSSLP